MPQTIRRAVIPAAGLGSRLAQDLGSSAGTSTSASTGSGVGAPA
ncbi:hypothetical protein [Kitasatospora sp. NBC_01266]|jgi:hypothetical protein|nr:hypothetical protein [Kitasatospora sp. NBC_01266]